MSLFSQSELQSRIVLCEDAPRRTTALEQRIQIGTGFHKKWYRSQKEHWLGWTMVKHYTAKVNGKDPHAIQAKTRWNTLNCLPMMFWLAEVSGVDRGMRDEAEQACVEAAKIKPHDCAYHGGVFRKVIPWRMILPYLDKMPSAGPDLTQCKLIDAYDHLVLKSRNSAKYRMLRDKAQ